MSVGDISIGDKFRSNANKWTSKEYYATMQGTMIDGKTKMREVTITGLNPGDPNGREVLGVLDDGRDYSSPLNVFVKTWEKVVSR